jgi:hypothetical protein
LVEFLNVDVNQSDELGSTPLFYARENDNSCIAEYLVEHGAVDPDLSSELSAYTPVRAERVEVETQEVEEPFHESGQEQQATGTGDRKLDEVLEYLARMQKIHPVSPVFRFPTELESMLRGWIPLPIRPCQSVQELDQSHIKDVKAKRLESLSTMPSLSSDLVSNNSKPKLGWDQHVEEAEFTVQHVEELDIIVNV